MNSVPSKRTKDDGRVSAQGNHTMTDSVDMLFSSPIPTPTVLVIREADILPRQATHLLGTLGHVSEGKSTLIRALTGVKTQRHTREQETNCTIHLGYANAKIYRDRETGRFWTAALAAAGACATVETSDLVAHISAVDCPGHEKYLATMLGGASRMDSACLIVAANQAVIPQPQTLEHLIAAELMGLSHIAIVQNKLDLVPRVEDAVANRDKIAAFTSGSIAGDAPLFPVSAQHGWGVDRVLEWIVGRAATHGSGSGSETETQETRLNKPARLTCVRSFDINRPGPFTTESPPLSGAVLGGNIEQGILVVGDDLEIRPGVIVQTRDGKGIAAHPLRTRIRGLRCDTTDLPLAVPGSLIAIATDLDPSLGIANGLVGQRVGTPGTLPPIVGTLDLHFRRLKRDEHTFGRHHVNDRVRVCSNVATVLGTLIAVAKGSVRIQLDAPLCVGIGEAVSILRTHKDAGRELLEGSGLVTGIEEWPDIVSDTYAAAVVVPQFGRRIVWEPLELEEWSSPSTQPSYADMLADLFTERAITVGGGDPAKFSLCEITLQRLPKQTVWSNWALIVEVLDRSSDATTEAGVVPIQHCTQLRSYLEAELATTSALNGLGQLVLVGRWPLDGLRTLVRKYVKAFKQCAACRSYDTHLIKMGRAFKIRCARCHTEGVAA